MARKDLLQRGAFIDLLDQIIIHKIDQREGLSLAIDGKWGCGKSFILKELEGRLQSKGHIVIHYNCWENDFYEEPLIALIESVVNSTRPLLEAEIERMSGNESEILGKVLKPLAKAAAGLLGIYSGVNLWTFLKYGIEAFKHARKHQMKISPEHFDGMFPLKKAISLIQVALLELKSKDQTIIFVIDEIDRCLPEYAIKILERLHHICHDDATGKERFIRIMAMNRDELTDSIANVFGRTIVTADTTALVAATNRRKFADYYFQKFIQLTIPVPEAKLVSDDLAILNGFENQFKETPSVPRRFVAELLAIVVRGLPMRLVLECIELAKTTHQLALIGTNMSSLSYRVLTVELIDCLFRSVLKRPFPEVEKPFRDLNGEPNNTSNFKIEDSIRLECLTDGKAFAFSLRNWSKSRCGTNPSPIIQGSNIHYATNIEDGPASFVKAIYCLQSPPVSSSPNSVVNQVSVNSDETVFIKTFRKALDTISPL